MNTVQIVSGPALLNEGHDFAYLAGDHLHVGGDHFVDLEGELVRFKLAGRWNTVGFRHALPPAQRREPRLVRDQLVSSKGVQVDLQTESRRTAGLVSCRF